jgi:hypothetical protein
MENDVTFRTKSVPTQQVETKPAILDGKTTSVINDVEVPYTSYSSVHAKPYSVDYFELGDMWKDGFSQEISTLEEYFTKKIESGDIENSSKAVEKELKKIERLSNFNKDERKTLRVGTAAAYAKFLMDSEDIKFNIKRYGNTK